MARRHSRERLTAADASNVELDAHDQVNVFLMAGLLRPGGFVGEDGSADLGRLRATIAARLGEGSTAELRRFAQRVTADGRFLVWDSCEPDLRWHVRAVEPLEGRAGLSALCASLMSAPLPADRPLWELVIVPGATSAGPGIVLRVHHAVADGVGGVQLAQRLFGAEPNPVRVPLVGESPAVRLRPLKAFVAGVGRVTAMFRDSIGQTVLLGPIGPRRGVAFADVDLAQLARGARTAGGTVNDALLAAVSVAAEATLRAAGESVPAMLPASVPVALPDRGRSGNAVGVMLVPLPTGGPDTADRLARIASVTRAAKSEARSQGTFELTRTRWGSRLFAALARRQRFIALFVTNVRGPAEPLLVAGAPLAYAWPVAPIQGNVRFGVAAFSYAGRLGCSVHVDADALRADLAGRALEEELVRISRLG